MKQFNYQTYNEYLANLCGLAQILRTQYDIPARMEVLGNKKGQYLYRLSIDGVVDAKSFADIVWAGVSEVGFYLPTNTALYFGDAKKSFKICGTKEKEGRFISMTANGYEGFDTQEDMLGAEERNKLSELARKVADVNSAGYYVSFIQQNEKVGKGVTASDLLGDEYQTTDEF